MAKTKSAGTPGARQHSKTGTIKTGTIKTGTIKTGTIKTGMIRARIDPALKGQAEAILSNLGLNASDAIRLLYKQITLLEGLPFPVKIPNAETRKAIRDADAGKVTRHRSTAEMFKKMGI